LKIVLYIQYNIILTLISINILVAKLIIEDLSIRKGKIIYSAYKFVLISLTTSLNAVRMASALCINFFHFFHILEEEEENLKRVSRFSNRFWFWVFFV